MLRRLARALANLACHALAFALGALAALPLCALIFWLGDLYLY